MRVPRIASGWLRYDVFRYAAWAYYQGLIDGLDPLDVATWGDYADSSIATAPNELQGYGLTPAAVRRDMLFIVLVFAVKEFNVLES